MSEAEAASGAESAGTNETAPQQTEVPAWTPPASREDFEQQARDFALGEEIEVGGKKQARRAWLDGLPQYAGLNAKHQKVTKEAEQYRAALESVQQGFASPAAFRSLAQAIGVDPVALAQSLVQEQQQYESMTPEQRELAQLKAERETWQQQQQRLQEEQHRQQTEAQQTAQQNYFLEGFSKGVQSIGWNPPDQLVPHVVATMSAIVEQALQSGTRMSWDQIARLARQQLEPDAKSLFANMKPEDRLALLSEEDRQALRRQDLESANRPKVHHSQTQPRENSGQFQNTGRGEKPIIVGSFRDFQRQTGRG